MIVCSMLHSVYLSMEVFQYSDSDTSEVLPKDLASKQSKLFDGLVTETV